jgi:gluconokinase
VLACSALKRTYRDVLRAAAPGVRFLHLRADRKTITERVARRSRHFMPATLVSSQFDALEEPTAEEAAILDATLPLDTVLRLAVEYLKKDVSG